MQRQVAHRLELPAVAEHVLHLGRGAWVKRGVVSERASDGPKGAR